MATEGKSDLVSHPAEFFPTRPSIWSVFHAIRMRFLKLGARFPVERGQLVQNIYSEVRAAVLIDGRSRDSHALTRTWQPVRICKQEDSKSLDSTNSGQCDVK